MEFYEKQLGSVSVDGKLLRRGFTTGTAAAAAAKGAYLLLSTGEVPDIVDVKLPSGLILKIITDFCSYDSNTNTAFCSVKKYAGRLLIFAVISQLPYYLAFARNHLAPWYTLNMIFTLW